MTNGDHHGGDKIYIYSVTRADTVEELKIFETEMLRKLLLQAYMQMSGQATRVCVLTEDNKVVIWT